VQLTAEIYNQASAVFGVNPLQDTVVLDQTFNDVELVGKAISLSQFVNRGGLGAGPITATTTTYSPYLELLDEASSIQEAQLIRGTDFQETLTNFPLGSQLLTGAFLTVQLTGPAGPTEHYDLTLADRIGYDVRQHGGHPSLTVGPNDPPLLTELDSVTIAALGGLANPAGSNRLVHSMQALAATALPSNDSAAQDFLSRSVLFVNGYVMGSQYMATADHADSLVQDATQVKAYFDRPRLVAVSQRIVGANQDQLATHLDLVRTTMRPVVYPGQSAVAASAFAMIRGVFDTAAESNTVTSIHPGAGTSPSIDTSAVFEAAVAQGINFVVIEPGSLSRLDALALSAQAKERITAAVQDGKVVIVPAQMVDLGTGKTTAWLETNPATGDTIGVLEDGSHGFAQTAALYAGVIGTVLVITAKAALSAYAVFAASQIADAYALCRRGTPDSRNGNDPCVLMLIQAKNKAFNLIQVVDGLTFNIGTADKVFLPALKFFLASKKLRPGLPKDPPVPDALVGVAPPPEFPADSAVVPVTASLTPGTVQGTAALTHAAVTGQLTANWSTTASTSSFAALALQMTNGSVRDAAGNLIGSGSVALQATALVPVQITGSDIFAVTGQGSLAFYANAGGPECGGRVEQLFRHGIGQRHSRAHDEWSDAERSAAPRRNVHHYDIFRQPFREWAEQLAELCRLGVCQPDERNRHPGIRQRRRHDRRWRARPYQRSDAHRLHR
jgi:hypothetical protein